MAAVLEQVSLESPDTHSLRYELSWAKGKADECLVCDDVDLDIVWSALNAG